ncbi:DUF2809 domain-containing protein [Mucilaginibacter sp. ZT4R22]|uniref:DUF2809 domain-containing protein n=1 Tax=Mucilaginibacter pankratovii TaxID=2772110 RepID=A0ABR7WRY0_9SPHI|nr:DUF2809 domain-containing protein [Mucilaginibacter pankratovii]MBD1365064.1 DUF2809 domain-containing protein [Mucilaginibacter pankratovii]
MKFRFNKYYFALAAVLFNVEVLIANFVHDSIIRPYGGDFLVVILVYCAIKAFIKSNLWATAVGVLILSYVVEIAQYYHLIYKLGWENSAIARNLLGTTFKWEDLLAYTLGMVLVVMVETWLAGLKQVAKKNG